MNTKSTTHITLKGFALSLLLIFLGATSVALTSTELSAQTDSASAYWSTTGNAGTNPGLNILGTTDDNALEIHVNNLRAIRLQPGQGFSSQTWDDTPSLIGGSFRNSVPEGVIGATISGGGWGSQDVDTNEFSSNDVTADFGTVSGGIDNKVSASDATISGGRSNRASGYASTITGGLNNSSEGLRSTVVGGFLNVASGEDAIVLGGNSNLAAGRFSVAAGREAQVLEGHDGTFLFADSVFEPFESKAANEFAVRASGGVRIATESSGQFGVRIDPGDTFWKVLSDRNAKENFQILESTSVLEKLQGIQITEWNYAHQGDEVKHIGPMAQDIQAVFGLSQDDQYISPIDLDGIALISIQGLYQLSLDQAEEIERLRAENEQLSEQLVDFLQRLEVLEASVLE